MLQESGRFTCGEEPPVSQAGQVLVVVLFGFRAGSLCGVFQIAGESTDSACVRAYNTRFTCSGVSPLSSSLMAVVGTESLRVVCADISENRLPSGNVSR